jgi:hypothetical protein
MDESTEKFQGVRTKHCNSTITKQIIKVSRSTKETPIPCETASLLDEQPFPRGYCNSYSRRTARSQPLDPASILSFSGTHACITP